LREQQFNVTDNIVYQDNQSSILLECNGHGSSGHRTQHIDIRYFFICDRIKNKELRVEYCPTKKCSEISSRSHYRVVSLNGFAGSL
jgi:hypothetical protein